MNLMMKLIREEEGQSMVEYGLIVAVVALVCVTTYKALGKQVNGMIEKLTTAIDTHTKNIK